MEKINGDGSVSESKLQLKVGHYYRRRDGEIVGPVTKSSYLNYPYEISGEAYRDYGGYFSDGVITKVDLIEDLGPVDPRTAVANITVESINKLGQELETYRDPLEVEKADSARKALFDSLNESAKKAPIVAAKEIENSIDSKFRAREWWIYPKHNKITGAFEACVYDRWSGTGECIRVAEIGLEAPSKPQKRPLQVGDRVKVTGFVRFKSRNCDFEIWECVKAKITSIIDDKLISVVSDNDGLTYEIYKSSITHRLTKKPKVTNVFTGKTDAEIRELILIAFEKCNNTSIGFNYELCRHLGLGE